MRATMPSGTAVTSKTVNGRLIPAERLHHRPQAPDRSPPFHHETVVVGVPARISHTPLPERELVLRVHERRGSARSHRLDATCPRRVLGGGLGVLAVPPRGGGVPGAPLAHRLPLPRAASPQGARGDKEKRQEDREREQRAAQEGI